MLFLDDKCCQHRMKEVEASDLYEHQIWLPAKKGRRISIKLHGFKTGNYFQVKNFRHPLFCKHWSAPGKDSLSCCQGTRHSIDHTWAAIQETFWKTPPPLGWLKTDKKAKLVQQVCCDSAHLSGDISFCPVCSSLFSPFRGTECPVYSWVKVFEMYLPPA